MALTITTARKILDEFKPQVGFLRDDAGETRISITWCAFNISAKSRVPITNITAPTVRQEDQIRFAGQLARLQYELAKQIVSEFSTRFEQDGPPPEHPSTCL